MTQQTPAPALGAEGEPHQVPVTGDPVVDGAMDLLRDLLTGEAPEDAPRDGQVLAAVHETLQRRLGAAAG